MQYRYDNMSNMKYFVSYVVRRYVVQSFAQRQSYPAVDPYDGRYPRHDPFKRARKVLRYSWTIFAIYLGNAGWNLWMLFSPLPPFPGYPKLISELIAALVLPYPLNNPNSPFWIYGIVFLILMIGGVCWGSFWAKNDIEHEKELLEDC